MKPRGKFERYGKKPVDSFRYWDIDPEKGIDIGAWCPDKEAKEPPEQVHLSLFIKNAYPIIVRFKSPDTLGFLIEELSRYRNHVWPDCEPVEFNKQFEDDDDLGG